MSTDTERLAQLRLLQFLSPVAPVGSYSYSQGLEWAVNEGWIHDETSFKAWVSEQIDNVLCQQELPLLARLYRAVQSNDVGAAEYWSQFAIALRDTAELRKEERDRGESYLRILDSLYKTTTLWPRSLFLNTPLLSIAWFSSENGIGMQPLLVAFAHNWLESNINTGMKTVPLGQSTGQQLLFELAPMLIDAVDNSLLVDDDSVGISLPALSMASCGHEIQYSRVYRS